LPSIGSAAANDLGGRGIVTETDIRTVLEKPGRSTRSVRPGRDLPITVAVTEVALRLAQTRAWCGRWRGNGERFSMLETIREFALERIEESEEAEEIRRAHAYFFRALAATAEPHIVEGSEQPRWLRMIETEHVNLRAALSFFRSVEDGEGYRSMTSALAAFWRLHGHLSEGRQWLLDALSTGHEESVLATKLLTAIGARASSADLRAVNRLPWLRAMKQTPRSACARTVGLVPHGKGPLPAIGALP
jgi:hypothetical protein